MKQQQQAQSEALQLKQAQSATIGELKQYTKTLNDKHHEAVKIVQKYQQITQELSGQTISATFSPTVQENLREQLQTRLDNLVENLQIDGQVRQVIKSILPNLIKIEIEKQTAPLAEQLNEKMDSVQQYHEKFEALIQKISSRL